MEIKPSNGSNKGIRKDLETLRILWEDFGYQRAV